MTQDTLIDAKSVRDTADWIIEKLQNKPGVSCELAIYSIGLALAALTAGQFSGERELLEGHIKGIRSAFEAIMAEKASLLPRSDEWSQ